MKKRMLEFREKRTFHTALFFIAFAVTVAAMLSNTILYGKAEAAVGSVSTKRYIAPRTVTDTVETARLREEARDSVSALYKHDTAVEAKAKAAIDTFFKEITEAPDELSALPSLSLPVNMSEEQYAAFNELSEGGKTYYRADVIGAAEFLFAEGITEDGLDKALPKAEIYIGESKWSPELTRLAVSVLSKAVEPNLVLDEEATNTAREQKAAAVEEVLILAGQKIVDEGEIISESDYAVLADLGLIRADIPQKLSPVFGSLLLVALIFIGIFLLFFFKNKRITLKSYESFILFLLYTAPIIITRLMASVYFVFIPLSAFVMLMAVLVDIKTGAMMTAFLTASAAIVYNGNAEFLLFFFISGSISAFLMRYTRKRGHIFLVSIAVAATNFITYFGAELFFGNGLTRLVIVNSLYAAAIGLLELVAVIGSIPMWESVFEVNTPFRLMEFANPDNELMRRLMIEAPGTYHHSLLVANMAETAAYDIGANAALTRAGAYYHDVGKLLGPYNFSENQSGYNPHDRLPPQESAAMIIQHPAYGKELAESYGLPRSVKSVILEHHGTTVVKYFYAKACKLYGEENVNENDYRYPGPVPHSREAALVMLADTVEAAIRSTFSDGATVSEVEEMTKKLIKDKFDEGQLYESGLAIKDLITARKAFIRVAQGMYHERVSYPPSEKKEDKGE